MKLIALKDFANVAQLSTINFGTLGHPGHVPKGTRFEIGKDGLSLLDLRRADPVSAQLIAQLVVTKSAGDASDKDVVKAVTDEIAVDTKREANRIKLDQSAQVSHLGEQVLATLKGGK